MKASAIHRSNSKQNIQSKLKSYQTNLVLAVRDLRLKYIILNKNWANFRIRLHKFVLKYAQEDSSVIKEL